MRVRPGKRGAILICLGILDVGFSWAVYASLTQQEKGAKGLLIPWWAWAALWLISGVTCLVYAFQHNDRVAFSVASAVKFAWGGVGLYRWLAGTDRAGWSSALVWITFSFVILTISSWPEPEDEE